MLSQKYRFHGHGSLNYVFKNGRKARDKYIGLRVTPNPRRKHTRVAVVVSKKIFKSATKRNRIRRRIYETVRHEIPNYEGVYDIVITVLSPEIINTTPTELTDSINEVSATLGLYDKAT